MFPLFRDELMKKHPLTGSYYYKRNKHGIVEKVVVEGHRCELPSKFDGEYGSFFQCSTCERVWEVDSNEIDRYWRRLHNLNVWRWRRWHQALSQVGPRESLEED